MAMRQHPQDLAAMPLRKHPHMPPLRDQDGRAAIHLVREQLTQSWALQLHSAMRHSQTMRL
jgi:hypothetical protein